MSKGYSNLSSSGSGYVSCGTMFHSSEGEYTSSGKHKSGGHGEDSISIMKSKGIDYEITRVYHNGVREGNIPNSKQTFSRKGSNHTWFPKDWSSSDIRKAGEFVDNVHPTHVDGVIYSSKYKGVLVGVIYNSGRVGTIFPIKGQGENK